MHAEPLLVSRRILIIEITRILTPLLSSYSFLTVISRQEVLKFLIEKEHCSLKKHFFMIRLFTQNQKFASKFVQFGKKALNTFLNTAILFLNTFRKKAISFLNTFLNTAISFLNTFLNTEISFLKIVSK